jgi:hypothetical protein
MPGAFLGGSGKKNHKLGFFMTRQGSQGREPRLFALSEAEGQAKQNVRMPFFLQKPHELAAY